MEVSVMKQTPTAPEHSANADARSPMNSIQVLLLDLLIVITVLWTLFGTVVGAMNAPNEDMSPHIRARDLLFYYRLERNLHAQDIVVLVRNDTNYVGRIVAAGGDTVDISDNGHLIVNGNYVSEPEITASTPRLEGFVSYPAELAEGEFFILADARGGAEDSRFYGVVNRCDILGRVFVIIRREK